MKSSTTSMLMKSPVRGFSMSYHYGLSATVATLKNDVHIPAFRTYSHPNVSLHKKELLQMKEPTSTALMILCFILSIPSVIPGL